MILTFSKQQFVDRILSGVKIHTIREDSHNRWKPGRPVQFWFGNPRNTRGKIKPYHFANGICEYIDLITMFPSAPGDGLLLIPEESHSLLIYGLDNYIDRIAVGDGFDDKEEFWNWFRERYTDAVNMKLTWFQVTEKLI